MVDQVTIRVRSLEAVTPRWMILAAVTAFVLLLSACTGQSLQTIDESASSPDQSAQAGKPSAPSTGSDTAVQAEAVAETQSALAAVGQALPPARTLAEVSNSTVETAEPVSVSIDRLGLDLTTVLAVGTLANGEMEVPPPHQVGWYRFGPAPGQAGSAVLAGHVASDGVDGVFRHLDQLEPGDLITVGFDNGISLVFAVNDQTQINKSALPFDRLFARNGPSQLALITCGGPFNYEARSYQDNVVITADLVG